MKTSTRPRELGGSFSSRRGHAAQLSISDTNHHVTEAIGDMYGDDDDYGIRDSRPLSFVASPLSESVEANNTYFDGPSSSRSQTTGRSRPPLSPNGNVTGKSHTLPTLLPSQRHNQFDHAQLSPALSLRENSHSPSDTQFPLNDIDYQSTPAAVAQELSNLQALRRMSMDVGSASDPDLPSFQGVSLMPSVAPVGDDDEDDPSRLFWVPARVHPELAPMEFRTFIENRVQTIKRRSGEFSSLSPDGPERNVSGGSLRRKKSMLSRQIDNSYGRGAIGYRDGAEQLERKKSLSQNRTPELKISDLKELDELVKDPSKAMQKLTLDTSLRHDAGMEDPESEDMPILPGAPGGGLQRSRRTTYRRGSLRKGERVPFSKRVAAARNNETDAEDTSTPSPSSSVSESPLTRVPSEPNFSRPGRAARRAVNAQAAPPVPAIKYEIYDKGASSGEPSPHSYSARASSLDMPPPENVHTSLPPRKSSFKQVETPIPQIIETPPPPEEQPEEQVYQQNIQYADRSSEEHTFHQQQIQPQHLQYPEQAAEEQAFQQKQHLYYPERSSSQTPSSVSQQPSPRDEPPPRSSKRPVVGRQASSTSQPIPKASAGQTLIEMAQQPSPLPGSSARTDSLTFIPTITDDKKSDKKSKRDEPESTAPKKSTWAWFKGSDEKEKKDKRKDEELKRGKTKHAVDKSHDSARLDVLQHSIDTAVQRGRESLLLDRESIDNKLSDERKKESSRKSGEGKKERDGIFSSLFGNKKKNDRDTGGKKASSLRTLSPEPPYRQLRPDIDYNWTRFSLLEERAIYRMAHIKLANPRRALYSQVLLSNFMYSYLAKVQQMHPHVQIPQSAQQKKQLELEKKQKEEEQRNSLEQQQQAGEQYRYDYHQGIAEYADQQQSQQKSSEGVTYVDDSQIYDYEHQENDPSRKGADRPQSRGSKHTGENGYALQNQYGRQGQDYYSYEASEHENHRNHDDDDDGEMW